MSRIIALVIAAMLAIGSSAAFAQTPAQSSTLEDWGKKYENAAVAVASGVAGAIMAHPVAAVTTVVVIGVVALGHLEAEAAVLALAAGALSVGMGWWDNAPATK